VDDDRAWAAIAGRLRHWVATRRNDYFTAGRELDPAYAPERSWAEIVRREEAADAATARRRAAEEERIRREAEFAQLMIEVPEPCGDDAQLIGWLARALPFTDAHRTEVALAMVPFAARILALDAARMPDADRRIRRRLEKLKTDLRDPAGLEAPNAPVTVVTVVAPPPPPLPPAPPARSTVRRAEVVAFTRGRRAAFVGNRRDEELRATIVAALELDTLDWYEGEPRRIAALVDALRGGAYAIVLSATGFLDHAVDGKLVRACRRAGTRYVRVNRGRPAACVRALERDIGVGARAREPRARSDAKGETAPASG
jgi:hypothetical protein